MRRQRIVNRDLVVRKILAVSQIYRDRGPLSGEGNHLLPSLVAREEEIFVPSDGTSNHSAELVLVMAALAQSRHVVLEAVGVQHAVPEVVIDVAMPFVCSRLDGRVHD